MGVLLPNASNQNGFRAGDFALFLGVHIYPRIEGRLCFDGSGIDGDCRAARAAETCDGDWVAGDCAVFWVDPHAVACALVDYGFCLLAIIWPKAGFVRFNRARLSVTVRHLAADLTECISLRNWRCFVIHPWLCTGHFGL